MCAANTIAISILLALALPTSALASGSSIEIKMMSEKARPYSIPTHVKLKLTGPEPEMTRALERLRNLRFHPRSQDNGFRAYRLFGVTHVRFKTDGIVYREGGFGPVLTALYPTESPKQRRMHLPARTEGYSTGHSSYDRYGK